MAPLRAMPEIVPGALAAGVFVAWSAAEGGFGIGSYSPGALFLAGLLVATAVAYRARLREIPRLSVIALAAFAAFAVWSFLSITWSDDQGIAWEGANRALLYLVVVSLFTLPSWRTASVGLVIGGFSIGVAVVGVVSLLETANAAAPETSFIDARWIDPTGYHNSSAALHLIAFWPALFLASRREIPPIARGILLAAAGVLLQLAVIPQSRGAMIAFPIVLGLYLALVPGRVRCLLVIVPIAVALALSANPLLDVYPQIGEGGDPSVVLDAPVSAIAITAVALLALGCALGIIDRRVSVPRRATWLVGRGVAMLAGVGVLMGGAVFVAEQGNPVSWVDDRWEDFKSGQPERHAETRFGGSLGSNRYDFWRVAIGEFADAPLTGIGADNFAIAYLRERRSDEEPLHPHSLPIRLLSQTGIVGAALFAAFMIAALVAATRARWRCDGRALGGGLAAVSVVAFSYWVVHGTGDWLWTFPALSAPTLAWLVLAARLDASGAEPQPGDTIAGVPAGAPRAWRLAAVSAASVIAAFAAVSFTLPWAAARDVDAATAGWSTDPEDAFDRLDRARKLNFLSGEPDLVAGTIAIRLDDEERARAAFDRAREREPHNWYALLQLGALDARAGRRQAALRHLRTAASINPDDGLIELVLERTLARRTVSPQLIDHDLVDRICERIGIASGLERCR